MPYKLRKRRGGYKVTSPNHPKGFNKKPLTLRQARAQLSAIRRSTGE